MTLSIVILAAGQGKRMHSRLPKVLHTLAGKPLLEHVIDTCRQLNPNQPPIVVYGHEGEKVQQQLAHLAVTWAHQAQALGTGHALLQALPHMTDDQHILVLYGDVPLITAATLTQLLAATPKNAVGIITAHVANPTGLGRIVRDTAGEIIHIIEEKDANDEQRVIQEINSGIYVVPAALLKQWLPALKNQNAQQEYYLTDIITHAVDAQIPIHSIQPRHPEEVFGINDCLQLATQERYYQRRQAEALMLKGVTLYDPHRFDLRGNLTVGTDVVFDINVIIEGNVSIGNHCIIGPNTILRNTFIGDGVEIKANSVIDGAEIAANCVIGPFARIRPGTTLATDVHIGNFVEIKNSAVRQQSKINHLSYVGDSDVGQQVNIGAGTITCNYDGVNKHRTIIGDAAFIGSNSQLVAPVTIGEGATIGAGSTITRDAPPHKLTLCRTPQRTIDHWQRPTKNSKKEY